MSDDGIGLVEYVDELREQLTQLNQAASEKSLQFQVEGIEVELRVTATRTNTIGGKGNAKFSFKVFNVVDAEIGAEGGGERKRASETSQLIRLKLRPVDENALSPTRSSVLIRR